MAAVTEIRPSVHIQRQEPPRLARHTASPAHESPLVHDQSTHAFSLGKKIELATRPFPPPAATHPCPPPPPSSSIDPEVPLSARSRILRIRLPPRLTRWRRASCCRSQSWCFWRGFLARRQHGRRQSQSRWSPWFVSFICTLQPQFSAGCNQSNYFQNKCLNWEHQDAMDEVAVLGLLKICVL